MVVVLTTYTHIISSKQQTMKTLILLASLLLAHSLFSQIGGAMSLNISSQTNYDPTLPQDGTFQWNDLITPGLFINYTQALQKRIDGQVEMGYQMKGFKERALTGIIGGPSSNGIYKNKFHNLVFRGSGIYYLGRQNIQPFCSIGAEVSYLLGHNLESKLHPIIGEFYPYNLFNGFNKFTLGYLLGVGIKTQHGKFHFLFNRDISPVLKKETLVVKNWIWSIKLDFVLNNS